MDVLMRVSASLAMASLAGCLAAAPRAWAEDAARERPGEVLLILGSGFEDLEAVSLLSVCGWTRYRDEIPPVHVTVTGFHPEIVGWRGTVIRRDLAIEDVDPAAFDVVAMPGGF